MKAPEAVLNLSTQESDQLRAKALAVDANELPKGYYRSPRVVGTFVAITICLIASYFAFLGSSATIASINQDVGPSTNVTLYSTVWTNAQAVSILLMGRLTDRFGRRPYVVGTNILGLIGGIVACTATSMETLIGAQVLLGICAGQSAGYTLFIGEIMSNNHKFIGTIAVAIPNILTGFAPYLGQRLGAQGHWRWIYYIYIIAMVFAVIISFFCYHPPSFIQLHGKSTSRRDELRRVDWVGVVLIVAGITLFLLGISWGGQPDSAWNSPKILGLLVSGAVSIVAFVFYECYANVRYPIVPMHFFRDIRGFTCITIISIMAGVLNLALFILYPQQVQRLFGSGFNGWEEIAWMSSAATFGTWSGICVLGSVFHIVKNIRWQIVIGTIWVTAFLGAMSSVTREDKNEAIIFSFLAGFLLGFLQDCAMLMVQFISRDEDLGAAFAIVAGSRAVFGSMFNAAFIALYTNKFPGKVQSTLVPAVRDAGLSEPSISQLVIAVLSDNATAVAAVPGMTPDLIIVTNNGVADSWAGAYAYVYYFATALGVMAIAAAFSLKDLDHHLTTHVPRQIYTKDGADKDLLESPSCSLGNEK